MWSSGIQPKNFVIFGFDKYIFNNAILAVILP